MKLYGIHILKRIIRRCRCACGCSIKFMQTQPNQTLCEACRNGDGEA